MAARRPNQFNLDLAASLRILAQSLGDSKLDEDALDPIQQTIAIYEVLAGIYSDTFDFEHTAVLHAQYSYFNSLHRFSQAQSSARKEMELRSSSLRNVGRKCEVEIGIHGGFCHIVI